MTYIPILKAKQGELKALQMWDDVARPDVHPLLEITPWERAGDAVGSERDSQDTNEIHSAVKRIVRAWDGKRAHVYIDSAYAEPDLSEGEEWSTTEPVLNRLMTGLAEQGIRAAPAIRASVDPEYSRWVGHSLRDLDIGGALIRVTSDDLDDSVIPLRQLVLRTASALGLDHSLISVVLDFGTVADDNASALAARLARFVLPQLAEDGWRRLVLASGAFPPNLSDVQPYEPTILPRRDVHL